MAERLLDQVKGKVVASWGIELGHAFLVFEDGSKVHFEAEVDGKTRDEWTDGPAIRAFPSLLDIRFRVDPPKIGPMAPGGPEQEER